MNEPIEAITTLQECATNYAALLAAGAALGAPQTHSTPDARPYALVPDGYTIQQLPRTIDPERAKGTVKLRDAASFIQFYKDHAVARSRVYAQLEPARFLAVFDEFNVSANAGMEAQADWREFRALFEVPASREWRLWNEINHKPLTQLQFAEFLQDNLPDVVQPDGATLLEMALNFEAAESGTFIATQRLQNGSHNLQWKADNNASGTVKLPEFITLSIPVFENEGAAELQARLRYRVKEGALTLWFELIRPHKVLEAAFRATWQRIADEALATILLGSPE